jgi:hypothetical protein
MLFWVGYMISRHYTLRVLAFGMRATQVLALIDWLCALWDRGGCLMASLDDHFAHRWMEDRAQKSTPNWELTYCSYYFLLSINIPRSEVQPLSKIYLLCRSHFLSIQSLNISRV